MKPDLESEAAMQQTSHSAASTDDEKKTKKKKEVKPMASLGETLSFVFECGPRLKFLFALGMTGGILNGLVYPALAYLFSNSFGDISGASDNGLGPIRELAFTFMIVGTWALVNGTIQSWAFEIISYHASQNFRLKWFKALLRQGNFRSLS
jgi:ATP-binding cassette subfamily B (MDR/TAP) protein 1